MAGDTGTGLRVELVAADRTVWSGEATMVIARTVEGDVGVLRGHAPMLSLLTDATVEITTPRGRSWSLRSTAGSSRSPTTASRSSPSGPCCAEEITIDEARAELEAANGLPTRRRARAARASCRGPDPRGREGPLTLPHLPAR